MRIHWKLDGKKTRGAARATDVADRIAVVSRDASEAPANSPSQQALHDFLHTVMAPAVAHAILESSNAAEDGSAESSRPMKGSP